MTKVNVKTENHVNIVIPKSPVDTLVRKVLAPPTIVVSSATQVEYVSSGIAKESVSEELGVGSDTLMNHN